MKKYLNDLDIKEYKKYLLNKMNKKNNDVTNDINNKIYCYLNNIINFKISLNSIYLINFTIFYLASIYFSYGNINNVYYGLNLIIYLLIYKISEVYGEKNNTETIITEYIKNISGLGTIGIIQECIIKQLGLENKIVNNVLLCTTSFSYVLFYFGSIVDNKILLNKYLNIWSYYLFSYIVFIINLKLINTPNTIYLITVLVLNIILLIRICTLIKKVFDKTENLETPFIILIYYILKYGLSCYRQSIYLNTIGIVDMVLMFELINYKFMKKKINNFVISIPILYTITPLITTVLSINYLTNKINIISKELKISILSSNRKIKVFCCGVFDMCHLGLMMLFKKIHEYYSNLNQEIELIVGVHSDKVCESYKRTPIINENLRYKTVELCKYVDIIIKDCPLVITKKYILTNNFDVVIIGEEYKDNKDRDWYPGAFELDNYLYITRFTEISTSDIIKKIKSH